MKNIVTIFFLCLSLIVSAQDKQIMVQGIAPNLYLQHTVTPKESFFSIGRLYNQAPKLIASFNNLQMEKGLAIGQTIKIPLNSLNLDLAGSAVAGETLVPLYHVVTKNETLFRISNNHAAKVEAVMQWNNLSTNPIEPGRALVVGHLRVKNEQLAALNNGNSAIAPATPQKEVKHEPVVAKETPPMQKDNKQLKISPGVEKVQEEKKEERSTE